MHQCQCHFSVWEFIAPYGWPISFIVFISYILYSHIVRPKLDQIREAQKVVQQKKFGRGLYFLWFSLHFTTWFDSDQDLNVRFGQRVLAVRQRQQLEHDFISQEERRLAEETARKELKELEEVFGHS